MLYLSLRKLAPVFLLLSLAACSTLDLTKKVQDIEVDPSQQKRSNYCDSYIGYEMCSMDLAGDGKSDVLYFDDTKEIFIYWAETESLMPDWLVMHECVQPMEETMRKAATDLLYFPEDLGFIGRQRLRGALLLSYTKYVGYVNDCYEPGPEDLPQEDYGEFGEEDF